MSLFCDIFYSSRLTQIGSVVDDFLKTAQLPFPLLLAALVPVQTQVGLQYSWNVDQRQLFRLVFIFWAEILEGMYLCDLHSTHHLVLQLLSYHPRPIVFQHLRHYLHILEMLLVYCLRLHLVVEGVQVNLFALALVLVYGNLSYPKELLLENPQISL